MQSARSTSQKSTAHDSKDAAEQAVLQRLLAGLNRGQLLAAEAPAGPVLVLAGAGSGKTTVLTIRFNARIVVHRLKPNRILCATFTKAAALEMNERIAGVLKELGRGHEKPEWIGTYHSLGLRMLKEFPRCAKLRDDFKIADETTALDIITDILRSRQLLLPAGSKRKKVDPALQTRVSDFAGWLLLEGDDTAKIVKTVSGFIEKIKSTYNAETDTLYTPGDCRELLLEWVEKKRITAEAVDLIDAVSKEYQDALREENLADFSDMLLWPVKAMRDSDHFRRRMARRFDAIMGDEVQDTSALQFYWLELLGRDHGDLFVVGDEDQTLYGWRQAAIENILNFSSRYPACTVVRLELNYRNTGNILSAANSVIANNQQRLGKTLRQGGAANSGAKIAVLECCDPEDEAELVAWQSRIGIALGTRAGEIAVLYRTNRQSRAIEEALVRHGLLYRVHGGDGFWASQEIKDALAWLKLTYDRGDAESFMRIADRPARGLGEVSVAKITEFAAGNDCDLFSAAAALGESGEIKAKPAAAMAALLEKLDTATREEPGSAGELLDRILSDVGYRDYWDDASNSVDAADRLSNIDELIESASRFDSANAFLGHAQDMINGHQKNEDGEGDRIRLMTGHRSKGLEFDEVYLVGWGDGVFPSKKAIDEGRIEEERRIAYVKLTRARKKLFVSYELGGRSTGQSCFLAEIPEGLTERLRRRMVRAGSPSDAALKRAVLLGNKLGVEITASALNDAQQISQFIDAAQVRETMLTQEREQLKESDHA